MTRSQETSVSGHTIGASHEGHQIIYDHFSALPGVKRSVPGNCYCQTCQKPVPYWWVRGKAIPGAKDVLTDEDVAK